MNIRTTKEMSRNVLFVSVLLVACVVAATAQTDTRIDGVVQPFINSQKIPAAGVAVVRDGKLVVAKGYGAADLDAGTPVTENTGFQIASVTKQFTAAGIMLLVEQGKLKLDDEVAKYLLATPETTRRAAAMLNRFPDRFLFGSDVVAPRDSAQYFAVFDMYKPLWAALTPEASAKVRRGNYERIFDAGRRRVRAWEQSQGLATK